MILQVVGTGSSGNCYLLTSDTSILALDAGLSWNEIDKASGRRLAYDCEGLLVTHCHLDHCRSAKDFTDAVIDVWCGEDSQDGVETATGTQVNVLRDGWNHIGEWKVVPFPVNHDVPCYGFLIESKDKERILYATDFSYVGVSGKEFSFRNMNVNHFLIAVNYTELDGDENSAKREHVLLSHSSLETVKGFLKASVTDACKTVMACHLSKRNADEWQILRELTEITPETVNVAIARKGITYQL